MLLLPALLAGCSGGHGLSGTFDHKGHPGDLVRFKEDGTFTLNVHGTYAGSGTYELGSHEVTLAVTGGQDIVMRFRGTSPGDTIYDKRGSPWLKEQTGSPGLW